MVANSYYLNDYQSPEDMMIDGLKGLCKSKYKDHKVYIHNLAKFDEIFLLRILNKIGKVKVTMNKGRLIEIKFSFHIGSENKTYNLYFRDSYQILLASLAKLGKSFGVISQKGCFPHDFVTNSNLDYIGPIPEINYFKGITQDEYSNLYDRNWNLTQEAIKYCELDCISLYQIMFKFTQLVFDKFEVDINKYPTVSSLNFGIFRSKYLKKHKIPMISGKMFQDIKLSYTGGSTDMFIPKNEPTELIYGYDINLLYPYVMSKCEVPVGKVTYFEGDIQKYNSDAYGFFYCEVETPEYLDHPIIQKHIKTPHGYRTLAGLGKFETMIYSNELDNAVRLGYKFKIL